MKALAQGERVHVRFTTACCAVDAPGAVIRVNRDGSAWIALYERQADAKSMHPWPESDSRRSWVSAFPWHCDAADPTPAERRAS